MKTGLTIVELAKEIQRQADAKQDYLIPTQNVRMSDTGALNLADKVEVQPNAIAHRQIGEHVDIPAKYYDRMKTQTPALLAQNVNTWFDKAPATRMVRTLDGNARAFLSDRYRPLEYNELAEAVLPVLMSMDVEIMSAQITETRMYIKAVHRSIRKDLPVGAKWGEGHTIVRTQSPGIVISDSEVGLGALSVESSVFDRVCTNLAVFSQGSMKKYHTGAKQGLLTDNVMHLLTDETRKQTDKATWMQVADIVRGAFDEAIFEARVKDIAGLQEKPITDPIKTVEFTAKRFGLNGGEQNSILKHLIEGGDLSAYGLYNAVTRTAQDLGDYDRASNFESLGGKIIDLSNDQWREISPEVKLAA